MVGFTIRPVMMNKIAEKKKRFIFSVFVRALTYGHDTCIMTEKMRSHTQADKISFLSRVERLILINGVEGLYHLVGAQGRTAASPYQKESVEDVWASDLNAHLVPPFRCFTDLVETLIKASALALGWPWDPPDLARRCCCRKGYLNLTPEPVAPMTRSQIGRQQWV